MKCEKCKAEMISMIYTWFCPNDCDKAPKNAWSVDELRGSVKKAQWHSVDTSWHIAFMKQLENDMFSDWGIPQLSKDYNLKDKK